MKCVQRVPPEDLLPCIAYFHLFCYLFLFFSLCLLLLLVSLDIDPVLFVLELHKKYTDGGGPSAYVYCVVCYRVIAAPYVRSVGYVFAYLYTLDDDSELWDYETYLLPKVIRPY